MRGGFILPGVKRLLLALPIIALCGCEPATKQDAQGIQQRMDKMVEAMKMMDENNRKLFEAMKSFDDNNRKFAEFAGEQFYHVPKTVYLLKDTEHNKDVGYVVKAPRLLEGDFLTWGDDLYKVTAVRFETSKQQPKPKKDGEKEEQPDPSKPEVRDAIFATALVHFEGKLNNNPPTQTP